ncbi:Hypothetical Protein FCC1311_094262 [Hondaea fermentalgiana]|uniref:DSBA-like thioredoxin domain-containing protein n=1 Tax=Hondaea fermentalgiana TaxID=2315210 RepID=A0A2R5GQQ0_9STRA|nr:Hypothetical Protein FCC1311_094262 [Hondaea fermentalgiana]|eukprot:GBG33202.1 Hypothetical Protein FCC1311_094262 [Hondaea fermentalgiana]
MTDEEETLANGEETFALEIDVVSDYMCPWCYLGMLRLGQALMQLRAEVPEVGFQVRYWPRVLAPDLEGREPLVTKREMYMKRFNGSEEAVNKMQEEFEAMLEPFPEGGYTLDGVAVSTIKAHRLAQWARRESDEQTQWLLNLELFQAYHMFGYNLDDDDVLVRAAKRAGFAEERARAFLVSNDLEEEVRAMASDIRPFLPLSSMYNGGVPHFKVSVGGMELEIPGAQDIEYFVNMFIRMISKAAQAKL